MKKLLIFSDFSKLSANGKTILVVLSSLSITKILHGINIPIKLSYSKASFVRCGLQALIFYNFCILGLI